MDSRYVYIERYNGYRTQVHIAIDLVPVCGVRGYTMETKETYEVLDDKTLHSINFPHTAQSVDEIITCKKCLAWFKKNI